MKTKKLRYLKPTINSNSKYQFRGFVFGYDRNLRPVPTEVPEDVAKTLLKMVDNGCRCHHQASKKLFELVL